MPIVLSKEQYQEVWDQVTKLFNYPNTQDAQFRSPIPSKTYRASIWNEAQEAIVNNIFCGICPGQLYALDWQHTCFLFNPREQIPTGIEDWWYARESKTRIYFPSYYPDGDYYAFVSQDFQYGLFGHPWKQQIYVVGEMLVTAFEENAEELGLIHIP